MPRQAANRYRQHPQDYIDVLEATVKDAIAQCPVGTAEQVVGIAFDTTGSTPAFTDRTGMPLALLPEFAENPNAMFILWKDHTAVREAAEVNELCRKWNPDYTAYEGGIYSSEWYWAKALHVLREDEQVRKAAYSIVEHCEWLPALLTGVTSSDKIVRSRCACGHKAMWHKKWGGLPSEEFLTALDPLLSGFRARLFEETETADKPVGRLTPEWAERLGLTTGVVVAGGAFDCHMGAVGAGVTPHTLVRVIGTSTCDVMVADYEELGDKLIRGICGQVDGSVIPGMIGLEAGQSGFGDIYAWFKRLLEFPLKNIVADMDWLPAADRGRIVSEAADKIIPTLTAEAERIPIEEHRSGYGLDERPPHARRQPAAHRHNHGPHARQFGPARIPRAGRGHGIRHQGHSRPFRQRRRKHRQRHRHRRHSAQVALRHADNERRAEYADQGMQHRSGMRSWRSDVRRHGRGRISQGRGCHRRHELGFRQGVYTRRAERRRIQGTLQTLPRNRRFHRAALLEPRRHGLNVTPHEDTTREPAQSHAQAPFFVLRRPRHSPPHAATTKKFYGICFFRTKNAYLRNAKKCRI